MRSKADSPQLFELTRAVPKKFIKTPPAGKQGSYVPHFVVTQWILATLGPFDWELVQILRGLVEPTYYTKVEDGHAFGDVKREGLEDAVVGAVYRLTVMIDGQRVVIE